MSSHVKLGIIRLGTAAGKIKYTILDEEDIAMVEKYVFEPRIEIDRNGDGAKVYAYAYKQSHGRDSALPLHKLLWEKYRGGIAPGFKVIHKNGITVDNRLDNLALIRHTSVAPTPATSDSSDSSRCQTSLYYTAICQLPDDLINDHFPDRVTRTYNADGELTPADCDVTDPTSSSSHPGHIFYECRYPPCSNMELAVGEFGVCGRCRTAHYCGSICQQKDWPVHKKHCSHVTTATKRRRRSQSQSPER